MKLYIETQNGEPKNHPAFEQNLLDAFNSIPSHWEPFVRVERPALGVYEVLVSEIPTYSKIDGVWKDVWTVRAMTDAEKSDRQQAVKLDFNSRPQAENWSAWKFDEATCSMVPPIPRPEVDQTKLDAGILTVWCGAENNWKDTPVRPTGTGPLKFDFIAWQWVSAAAV